MDADNGYGYTVILRLAVGGCSNNCVASDYAYWTTNAIGTSSSDAVIDNSLGNGAWGSTNKKMSDPQVDALMKLSTDHRFKWYTTTTTGQQYIYLRVAPGANYSTTGLVEQQCTRTPDGQWSRVYATSGGLDYGLATRDYRTGSTTSTSVICKVNADNCFSAAAPNAYCSYDNFITMRYSYNDANRHFDICVRGARCSTSRNAVLLLG